MGHSEPNRASQLVRFCQGSAWYLPGVQVGAQKASTALATVISSILRGHFLYALPRPARALTDAIPSAWDPFPFPHGQHFSQALRPWQMSMPPAVTVAYLHRPAEYSYY